VHVGRVGVGIVEVAPRTNSVSPGGAWKWLHSAVLHVPQNATSWPAPLPAFNEAIRGSAPDGSTNFRSIHRFSTNGAPVRR
jgi:hypothetical protein